MLESHYYDGLVEAGCDEAGRGCLAGSVYAAAVILPPDYTNDLLNDSKQLTEKRRYALREQIERDALAWAVGIVTPEEIDKINILNASILAMHRALDQLQIRPEAVIVDGNRFKPWIPKEDSGQPESDSASPSSPSGRSGEVPYTCIVKGDGKYLSIAAASILAKTYRQAPRCHPPIWHHPLPPPLLQPPRHPRTLPRFRFRVAASPKNVGTPK